MSSFASMLARLHRGGHARIHTNSLAAMPHLCPLVHARGLHCSHHTTASSHITFRTQRSIQPRPAITLLHLTDSGTEGVGHRQRVKGVVGGAKKARAHIHAQACGWAVRWQRNLANECGKSGGRRWSSCIPSHGPFGEFLSSVS